MPTIPQSVSVPPAPQRVWVAIYEHRHGSDVHVFADERLARRWRTALAKEWWSDAFEDKPPPDEEIGDEYFERMQERDEFFTMTVCEVEAGSDDGRLAQILGGGDPDE